MESAWYYDIDGEKIDSERCSCLRTASKYCPIHGRKPDAKPYPKSSSFLCNHDFEPTFQGGDTYKCRLCDKEIDMTED